MKVRQILSFVTLLALVVSMTDGLSISRMKKVSAAERKTPATIEKILIPDEKYWRYEENEYEAGTICITVFNDYEIYTLDDLEKEEVIK